VSLPDAGERGSTALLVLLLLLSSFLYFSIQTPFLSPLP
jgi:hypothetical protein